MLGGVYMNEIFPAEIVENTTQHHFKRYNTTSKMIYLTVILAIIGGVSVLPFINMDISTQNRGIIRSQSEAVNIQTILSGEVIKVNLSENKKVNKDDTLLILKNDKLLEQIDSYKKKLSQNKDFVKDLNSLIKTEFASLKTGLYISEYEQYNSKIIELKTQLQQLEKEYQVSKELFEDEITPELEFLKVKNKYDIAKRQFNLNKQHYINKWQIEINRIEQKNLDLKLAIDKLKKEKQNYIIKAPLNGTINNYSGIREGSFLPMGQSIATISPNADLIVECYVSPSDIGYVKKGQEVVFQLDAFNHNQWGLARGNVIDISDDIYSNNNSPVFKIRCSLNEQYLQLKNGYKGYLKKGMTLTGRFFLTKRNLWQLLFDKVDNWINPKLIKEE